VNILIADDDATNRKLLRVALEAEGHHIHEAADGQEALTVLERQAPDAVISDILMPRLDGYRLCSELLASKRFRNLPIIVYSANYTSEADEKLALQVGADKYVKKPASTAALLKAIQESCSEEARQKRCAQPLREELTILRDYRVNLISNAVKFTSGREPAQIQIGTCANSNGEDVFFVCDNGTGFDMQYAHKLFRVFSACTCQTNSTAPASGWPTCTASFPATAGAPGPKANRTPGPRFTSPCPSIVERSRNWPHCVRVITSRLTPLPAPWSPGGSDFQPNPTRPLNCDSS